MYGLVFVVIGLGIGFYLWNKLYENMNWVKVDMVIFVLELFSVFFDDEVVVNEKYFDKVIEVIGMVVSFSISLEGLMKVMFDSGDEMFGVIC